MANIVINIGYTKSKSKLAKELKIKKAKENDRLTNKRFDKFLKNIKPIKVNED